MRKAALSSDRYISELKYEDLDDIKSNDLKQSFELCLSENP